MDHIPIDVTDEQRANLGVLSVYLIEKADRINFNMAIYAMKVNGCDLDPSDMEDPCGAIGCALGHGPSAGITVERDEDGDPEGWEVYGERAFGADDDKLWSYCFSGTWHDTDNTASGAGRRIRYVLDNGIPHDWDEQMRGKAVRSYDISS